MERRNTPRQGASPKRGAVSDARAANGETMTYSLHTVRHAKRADWDAEMIYRSYTPRYGDEILETVQVPVKIEFISSYRSHFDYSYYDPAKKEEHRFTVQFTPEPYREGVWNYPDEESFNAGYNKVNHMWGLGEPVPQNVFDTFSLMFPDVKWINGYSTPSPQVSA